ncbi:hypothetical protein FRB93_013393 [Tulasnella sp. JGI-2019a]|nr:hypothetical protein FRB93_013393 [Tulasnella sp. JGI-2019a]
MQTMLAAVRIDLGNVLPNNSLANRSLSLVNQTILSNVNGNTSSQLYTMLAGGDGWMGDNYPDLCNVSTDTPPSQITLQYQCQVEQKKSAGAIFVSVTVATVTLFQGGWAVFMLMVTFLAKRKDGAL